MRWGLIPHWAKDQKIGYKMINARIETLKEKPSYRGSLKSKRCLVPASGYYEWHETKEGKVPYYIHEKDEPLFGFAGLYDEWKDEKGNDIYSFTIITTDANRFMSKIHHRMPVILSETTEDKWLDKELLDSDKALALLEHSKPDLDAYEVSKAVNRPANDSSYIIKPLKK
jgi:putative SOS response-associated peptidase YedK